MIAICDVLVSPIATEKTVAVPGKYTFKVHGDANKALVVQAIKQHYGLDVKSVNITNIPGKTRSAGRRTVQKRAPFKKAVVTLKAGETLNFNDYK
ncbi:MAG TPA: 50S ribosomal protein L23 [Candidatus Gracilibacteria bacterium]